MPTTTYTYCHKYGALFPIKECICPCFITSIRFPNSEVWHINHYSKQLEQKTKVTTTNEEKKTNKNKTDKINQKVL